MAFAVPIFSDGFDKHNLKQSWIFILHTSYIRYNIAPSPKSRSRDFEFHLNCPIVLFLHDEVSSGNLL